MSEKFPQPEKGQSTLNEKFKESKVRDEKGALLKVFHFSDEDIGEFSLEHVGKNYSGDQGFFGSGVYFTDVEDAFVYGSKRYAAYLNLKNPLIVRNPTIEHVRELHGKKEELQKQGYDGVMVWNDASENKAIESDKMKGVVKGRKAGWTEICVFNTVDIFPLQEKPEPEA